MRLLSKEFRLTSRFVVLLRQLNRLKQLKLSLDRLRITSCPMRRLLLDPLFGFGTTCAGLPLVDSSSPSQEELTVAPLPLS